ncbi:MAG: 2-hydroxyacid dehydrogenase [Alphaproteobacteria bacterium]
MAILFKIGAGDPALWQREITARVPGQAFLSWPEVGDPDAVEFVLLFRAEPGMFVPFRNLKAILCTGAGVDGILADPQLPRDVPIARIVDPWMTTMMAQWVVHAVLRLERRMETYAAQQRRGEWRELEEWRPDLPRVGILGCGEIGGFVGRALAGLGFDVAGWTRTPRDLGPLQGFAGEVGLEPFLRRSDHLVCLLPLTPSTRGILNARTLALLPPGGTVVNAGRGGHIVTEDLVAALDSGHLSAAFLDVTDPEPLPSDHPLWRHPNVTITPHVAGITNPVTAAEQVAENIRRTLDGEPLLNRVDPRGGY